MRIKYSLVIPCFNEEQSLKELILEIAQAVPGNDIEFILVNNGSTDGSGKVFDKISHASIIPITLIENVGYGGGIKVGLSAAKGEFLGWIHADLQYSIIQVVNELKKVPSDAKYIKGKRQGRNLFQNYISLNMSIFESLLFQRLIYDINAQPTIFSRDFYETLKNLPDDFSIDLCSYVLAKKNNLKIFRFKVNFIKRSYGKSTWNSGLISLIKMSVRTMKYSIHLRRSF